MQLAWPFALIGVAVGAQLPAPFASAVIMALVLGLFGALVSGALPRVADWQVALMSPFVGATTGATVGWSIDSFDGAAVGIIAGVGFGLFALPPLVLITDGARRAMRLPHRSFLGARGAAARVAPGPVDERAGGAGGAGAVESVVAPGRSTFGAIMC